MPTYLVTFKLAADGTERERQRSLLDQFPRHEWWAETGSTVIVRDEQTIDDFCDRIFTHSRFDERTDMAVVFDLDLRDGRARGSFVDIGLFHIVPWLEKQ